MTFHILSLLFNGLLWICLLYFYINVNSLFSFLTFWKYLSVSVKVFLNVCWFFNVINKWTYFTWRVKYKNTFIYEYRGRNFILCDYHILKVRRGSDGICWTNGSRLMEQFNDLHLVPPLSNCYFQGFPWKCSSYHFQSSVLSLTFLCSFV